MAWHRKYRPKLISELHLTNVREALASLMTAPSFPQVFLFAGPKGTGKTSASRIIGAMLNDPKNAAAVDSLFFKQPSKKDLKLQDPDTESDFSQRVYAGSSFVVQEMDAASHRGIDDVRALKDRVMLPPQEGKITVYILDEAHMLTTEAFNALLKLLEEPPAHAVFILATTEFHKIPDTIVSRSFHLAFRKASDDELIAALTTVLNQEKITAEPEAIRLVVQRADGSFRDGVKLLETVVKDGKVTVATVEQILGKNVEPILLEMLQAVLDKDDSKVSELTNLLRQQKVAEKYVYQLLFSLLHQSLLQNLGVVAGEAHFNQKVARFLLEELLQAKLDAFSPISFLPLEIKLLALIDRAKQKSGTTGAPPSKKKIEKLELTKISGAKLEAQADLALETELAELELNSEEIVADEITAITPDSNQETYHLTEEVHELSKNLLENWDQFLKIVQQKNATVAALLRSSKPSLSETGIPEVLVYYKFHQEQLQQQKYMNLLQDCAQDLVGRSVPLQVALRALPKDATLVEVKNPSNQLTQLAEEALM